ncbi:NADH-quinone oxidoreductase subunit A [Mucilaginibacter xinganensis]|uniref:NADH-quinone oxidoreductase subunit A n=1 Tax=Mucilaginibacter xinganensis TaxID=1234841 RepID=A0A223P0A9_9SPHI|nr:NADH-quinone oxidoreductase subunit A [Mucilaginibacter xinganensis]ASU35271.1 NADH dehydrogenase [Mucilaginibacter xinganensis]
MAEVSQISEFGKILIFLITGIIMVCVAFSINKLLAPHNPNPEKLTSYECGEETTGNAWLPFNSRFYVIALVFLLFDVEMVFIFPWATVFGSHEINNYEPRWGWLALTEMFIFLGILILGLVYVWVKGDLDWIKPKPIVPTTDTFIPKSLYEKLNAEQSVYKVRAFALTPVPSVPLETVLTKGTAGTNETPGTSGTGGTSGTPGTQPIRKPMFKPTFKKPGNEQ